MRSTKAALCLRTEAWNGGRERERGGGGGRREGGREHNAGLGYIRRLAQSSGSV